MDMDGIKQSMQDWAALLEALRPFVDTEVESGLFQEAWSLTMERFESCTRQYVEMLKNGAT